MRTDLPSCAPSRQPTRKLTAIPSTKTTNTPTATVTDSTIVVEASVVAKSSYQADDPVMIFLYTLGGVVGMWCVYQILRCCVQAQVDANKRKRLRAELDRVQPALLFPFRFGSMEKEQSSGDQNPFPTYKSNGRMRGANASSVPSGPASVSSDRSSSIVVSSLHSSEVVSDLSYSIYSDELQSEDYIFHSASNKSQESMMEEGGSGSIEQSDCHEDASANTDEWVRSADISEISKEFIDDGTSVTLGGVVRTQGSKSNQSVGKSIGSSSDTDVSAVFSCHSSRSNNA